MADPAPAAAPRAFSVAVGEYLVRCVVGAAPGDFDRDTEHATLVDPLGASDGEQCCTLVSRVHERWPFLVVTADCSLMQAKREDGGTYSAVHWYYTPAFDGGLYTRTLRSPSH